MKRPRLSSVESAINARTREAQRIGAIARDWLNGKGPASPVAQTSESAVSQDSDPAHSRRLRIPFSTPATTPPDDPLTHTHICAAIGCGKKVRPGFLMCYRHWHAVPRNIQFKVWNTWRALNEAKTPEAISAYRAARDAAIASLHQKPETTN
jgi:hypothetical protein